MALAPISQHLEQIAALLRLDARALRRAVEIGDSPRALELATHIEALATELATEVPGLVVNKTRREGLSTWFRKG